MDYYSILGVSPNSSVTDIKHAYRSLSFKYHPDRNKSNEAGEQMRCINEAYETLSDKNKRTHYDMKQNSDNPLENILQELFKGKRDPMMDAIFKQTMQFSQNDPVFAFSGPRMFFEESQKHSPVILEKKIEITFEESFKGVQLPIVIEREIKQGNSAYHEQQKIYVSIPPGMDDGEIIEIAEKGNILFDVKGDIKLYIHVIPSSIYERRGLNLIYIQNISFKESICGFSNILNHIDGTHLKLKSSRGNVIQNGDEKIIKGRGYTRESQSGDLVIKFKVIPPKELSESQIVFFESL